MSKKNDLKTGQLRRWNHPANGGIFLVVDLEDTQNIMLVTYLEDGVIKRSLLSLFIEQSSEPIDTGDTNDV